MQQTKTTRSKQKPNRALHACHFIACFRTDGRGVGQWGGNSQKKNRAAVPQKIKRIRLAEMKRNTNLVLIFMCVSSEKAQQPLGLTFARGALRRRRRVLKRSPSNYLINAVIFMHATHSHIMSLCGFFFFGTPKRESSHSRANSAHKFFILIGRPLDATPWVCKTMTQRRLFFCRRRFYHPQRERERRL